MRAALAAVVFTLATSATGGIEHTILHGVSVGSARVWTGPQALPGLTEESLRAVVESSLRDAGISIDSGAPTSLMVSATVVVANLDPDLGSSPSPDAACFARIEGSLREDARLVRNGLRVEASSWHRGAQVSVPVESCAERVTEGVRLVLADFVETFRAMNPRTTPR
jgi:hypothetical protein